MSANNVNKKKSVERPFWQSNWQGIEFKDLEVALSGNDLATDKFYSAFYSKLFAMYEDYEALPDHWKKIKNETAHTLSEEIKKGANVLSYGCGLGYVEKSLVEIRKDIKVTAYDFSEIAAFWIKRDIKSVYYTNNIDPSNRYDVIYLCQVLYALPFKDCINLIKSLSINLAENGKLIVINSSIEDISPIKGIFKRLLNLVAKYRVSKAAKKNDVQFWGFERNDSKYIEMFSKAGLSSIRIFNAANQSVIVYSNSSDSVPE